jgi:TonB family protein
MFLPLDDRPDVPRVQRALSVRAGVIASIALHAIGVLLYLFAPVDWLEFSAAAATPVAVPPQAVRYVHIAPMVDRTETPIVNAPASDRDRRSRTRDRAAAPENPLPFSRGTTPERVEGANDDRPVEASPPRTEPASSTTPPPPDVAASVDKTTPDSVLLAPPPEPDLPSVTQALRNLRDYFRSQNFDNQQGGGTQPDTDIQFDSKGIDFGPWLRRFRVQIYRNWFVPQAAMLHKGRVVMTFHVHRDGRITDLQIIQPAAIPSFNTSAETAIRMCSPTLPLPEEYPLDKIFFTVTFHYNER